MCLISRVYVASFAQKKLLLFEVLSCDFGHSPWPFWVLTTEIELRTVLLITVVTHVERLLIVIVSLHRNVTVRLLLNLFLYVFIVLAL